MKILIFGGSGFLGNAFSSLLIKKGIAFSTVSRKDSEATYLLDISDFHSFKSIPNNKYNVIVNCATVLPGGDYLDNDYLESIYKTNIKGSQNICKWINGQSSVKKIINCSTLAVVAKPWPIGLNEKVNTYSSGNHVLYSSSKLTQELLFKTFSETKKINLTQIRFSALYGPFMKKEGLIFNLIDQASKNHKIKLTNASMVSADFLHVNDAAKIILAAIKKNINGIVNGASGIEITILQMAKVIKECFPNNIEIENIENPSFVENRSCIDVNKLKTIFAIKDFIKIKEGINEMIKL
jgi:UDP-glucose 4-epimerase